MLFRACGAKEGDTECHEPVPVIFDTNCIFHMNLPPVTQLKPMEVLFRFKLKQSIFINKSLFFSLSKKRLT